jgi:hypothetical protein
MRLTLLLQAKERLESDVYILEAAILPLPSDPSVYKTNKFAKAKDQNSHGGALPFFFLTSGARKLEMTMPSQSPVK